MEIDKYIKQLEKTYRIKINKSLKEAIATRFAEDYMYTEQDICEQVRKLIQSSYYKK